MSGEARLTDDLCAAAPLDRKKGDDRSGAAAAGEDGSLDICRIKAWRGLPKKKTLSFSQRAILR